MGMGKYDANDGLLYSDMTRVSVKNTFIDFEDALDQAMDEVRALRQRSEPVVRMDGRLGVHARCGLDEELPEVTEHEELDNGLGGTTRSPHTNGEAISSELSSATPYGEVFANPDMAPLMPMSGMATSPAPSPGAKLNVGSPPEAWADTVTVMMRNVPNKYTQGMLLTEINETGYLGLYDFLYLPIDPETNANRGYAFINFIDTTSAWAFKVQYEGRRMKSFNSSKYVSVVPATLQGFDANYAHYSKARVSRGDPAARPLFLRAPTSVARGTSDAPEKQRRGRRRRGIANSNASPDVYKASAAIQPGGAAALNNAIAAAAAAVALDKNVRRGSGGQPAASETDVRFCPNCGGKIVQGFRFCTFCGHNLERLVAVDEGFFVGNPYVMQGNMERDMRGSNWSPYLWQGA